MDTESNPNAAQVRIQPASATKTAGQRKHDLRIGKQPDYVDSTLSPMNRVLIQPKTATEMKARAVERRDRKQRKRAMKSNAAVSFSGIITFGHLAHLRFERLTHARQDAAFLELAQSVTSEHKADLTGLVVHVDEAGLHAHFQMDAYNEAGDALSDKVKKNDLRVIQDMTAEIMGRHCAGIERGRSKLERLKAGASPADVIHKKPAAMRRAMAADIEDTQQQQAELLAERDKLANRVAKLEAYGSELTEKGAKQLETALRRLAAKDAEVQDLSAKLERLHQKTSEARQEAAEAQDAVEVATARLKPLGAALEALDAWEADKTRDAWWDMTPAERVEAHKQRWEEVRYEGPEVTGPFKRELRQLEAEAGLTVQVKSVDPEAGIITVIANNGSEGKLRIPLDPAEIEKEVVVPFGQQAPSPAKLAVQAKSLLARRVDMLRNLVAGAYLHLVGKVWKESTGILRAAIVRVCDPPRTDPRKAPPPAEAKPFLDLPSGAQQKVRAAFRPEP